MYLSKILRVTLKKIEASGLKLKISKMNIVIFSQFLLSHNFQDKNKF